MQASHAGLQVTRGGARGLHAGVRHLSILLSIGAVGDLHKVCDKIMHETCDNSLSKFLQQEGPLIIDKTDFAVAYHSILL